MRKKRGTSKRVATEAAELLRKSRSRKVRSVAGSDLAQRRRRRRSYRRMISRR